MREIPAESQAQRRRRGVSQRMTRCSRSGADAISSHRACSEQSDQVLRRERSHAKIVAIFGMLVLAGECGLEIDQQRSQGVAFAFARPSQHSSKSSRSARARVPSSSLQLNLLARERRLLLPVRPWQLLECNNVMISLTSLSDNAFNCVVHVKKILS